MSKEETETVTIPILPPRPILKAKCEGCGCNLVKAPFNIMKFGKILCQPCSSHYPEDQILRRM